MTSKMKKYSVLIIAAVLLVAMAFAGAASADVTTYNSTEWNDLASAPTSGSYLITDGTAKIAPKNLSSSQLTLTGDLTLDFSGYTKGFDGVPSASNGNVGALLGNVNLDGHTLKIIGLNMTSVKVNVASSDNGIGGILGSVSGSGTLNFTNCHLVNCSIDGTSSFGYTGGLVGIASSLSMSVNVEDCCVKHCDVVSGGNNVGGLVGATHSASVVRSNVMNSTVASTTYNSVGGLVGNAVSASFETCGVENTSVYAGSSYVGGLVGFAHSASGIGNCLVKNCVIASGSSYGVGGLVGNAPNQVDGVANSHVLNCTIKGSGDVGGLVGYANSASGWSNNNEVLNSAVHGSATNITLVCGSLGMYAYCTADVNQNFINNGTFSDTITPTSSYGWNTIQYVTGQHSGGSAVTVTNLGTYGVVGGYGVKSAPTLSYNANGATSGTAPASKAYVPGSQVTVADKGDLARTGYKFNGWNIDSTSGELIKIGQSFTITKDTTLYANWSIDEYTITYNNMTGATNPDANPTTYNVTSSAIVLEDAYKQGYTFESWYNSTEFTEAYKNNTIPAGSTGDKVFYANWTVNKTTASVDSATSTATFGGNNVTALKSTSGPVSKVLLESVSHVDKDKDVVFVADNDTLEAPELAGYTRNQVISVFEINGTAVALEENIAFITVNVTFNDATNASTYQDKVQFSHYNTANGAWDTTPLVHSSKRIDNKVEYVVQTTSFSPFGAGIYTKNADPTPSPSYSGSTKQTGYTQILSQGQVAPTPYATTTPTVAPTASPTQVTPTAKPTSQATTQPTQSSPAPVAGLIAGLGAAALVLTRLRK